MNKVFVFCIGGTGLRVMKSIVMLMASGMRTGGYAVVPIVVDPHEDLEERRRLFALVDAYREVRRRATTMAGDTLPAPDGFFHEEIKTTAELNNVQNDTQQMRGINQHFGDYIREPQLAANDINHLLVATLFSQKNLDSPLSVGFKGNPNMGTVVLGDMVEASDWWKAFKTHCAQGDRVFIISSIFGGTGASGYPLLEKKIRGADDNPAVKGTVMGAVTVLPYYGLKDPLTNGSAIDSANFYTKTKAALAYYDKMAGRADKGQLSDRLYYVGEQTLRQVYENDEKRQDDTANFIELVAATALFDFLGKGKPSAREYLSRSIAADQDALDLKALGSGYRGEVKAVADFMLLARLVETLPKEKWFPLEKNCGFDSSFYNDAAFRALVQFAEDYRLWYGELAAGRRAFAPLSIGSCDDMAGWIKTMTLEAADDSYYLLRMVQAANKDKTKQQNRFRQLLQYAYAAIDGYTRKINE